MDKGLITYQKVKSIVQSKNYRFYTDPFDMNIVGIRTNDNTPNVFNDFICFAYMDDQAKPQIKVYEATTDPGTYWLLNPMSVKGTAIVKPGQYRNMWKIGLHSGYRALIQYGICTVYRDNDKNGTIDVVPTSLDIGVFAINYHHAAWISQTVDKWSAGCQVDKKEEDFNESMKLVDKQIAAGLGDIFTYTLLEENDFA